MPFESIREWLGLNTPQSTEFAPLRETLDALDNLEPDRARVLAAFAYLLGRVAHADQQVSSKETQVMEGLVRDQGFAIEDVTTREADLEDVFVQLTSEDGAKR